MSPIFFIALAFGLLMNCESFSQNDSTRYINGLPVTEDDTVQQFLRTDLEPTTDLRPVPPEALPPELRATLNEEDQYAGWSDTAVYYNGNTKLFIVHVRSGDGVKVFGLNEKGKPVTFREISSRPE